MRTSRQIPRGSITLVALSLAIVIGISLASYLALCQQSLLLSTRTIQLSKARQLAETGLEEALWSLNAAANSNTSVSSTAWSYATWTTTGLNKSCTITGYALGEGAIGQIAITIANFDGPVASPSVPSPTITATATISLPNLGDFTKTLIATAKPAPLFANAIGVVTGGISLPSGCLIDSWDSDYDPAAVSPTPNRDYNVSTAAVPYPAIPPAYTSSANCAAVVAAPTITLNGDATIYGYATTSGNAINNPSANGIIRGPSSPSFPKIDSARVGKSAFIPSFAIKAPTTPPSPSTWQYLPSNAAWGTSQSIGTPGVTEYWKTSANESGMTTFNGAGEDLFLNNNKSLVITGPVVLVVNEDFELKDTAKIEVSPTGRLEIYLRDDVIISSSEGFVNRTKEPKNLALFCTSEFSSDFSFTYTSPANFNGVICTTDTNEGINMSTSPEIYGAIFVGFTPVFTGTNLKVHYDTALQYLPRGWFKGVTTPYMIVQVTES